MIYCIDVMDVQQYFKGGNRIFYITDYKRPLVMDHVKVGFGFRNYLICPECGNRFVKLYLCGNRFVCRKCGKVPVYSGIQNTTKGGYKEIQYRMERYAGKHKIQFEYPFDYLDFVFDQKDPEALRVLQALENMRCQSIFFGVKYSSSTIRSVLSGDHPIMKDDQIALQDLRDHFYDWNNTAGSSLCEYTLKGLLH